jgi:catechol 2,3-dioxygenase-like lactoylglutathione lyase family enzyme
MNLNQVTLPSTDLSRSVAFYRQLGFQQIVDKLPEYTRFECPDGRATFSLHRVDRVTKSETIIYFECENLDREYDRLRLQGIAFDSPPQDQRWLWRESYLRDPDGNLICLYSAGESRRFPPWRLSK